MGSHLHIHEAGVSDLKVPLKKMLHDIYIFHR